MSEKPFVNFLTAFLASAVPVCGAAILFSLTVTGRELPKSPVELPATPTNVAQSSSYAKSAGPTARRRIDPESAPIPATTFESTDPDPTASVVGQPETVTEPDAAVGRTISLPKTDPFLVEHASAFNSATRETNVALSSAPAAMSEDNAPEKPETIHSAEPIGGRLESNAITRGSGPPETVPQLLGKAQKPTSRSSKKPNGSAYGAGVYAALARHKPTAVERGSTTVIFEIGGSGVLGDVSVGQSSGNARLDQVALQMVLDAAPFPPPPNGASSYTIRIDFQ